MNTTEKVIICELLRILDSRSQRAQTKKVWNCRRCFKTFQKRSDATRHAHVKHLGKIQSKLPKVSELEWKPYVRHSFVPKLEKPEDKSQTEFIIKTKKAYGYQDIQSRG